MKISLQEYISKSKQAVAANKAKGNRHAEFLATMYAQPSRFIEEILQNTEDAYARKVEYDSLKAIRFKLCSDRIEIHHNGKDFDEEDLISVTTFANTTKTNHKEVNQIGKFGIGFKSVFSITDTPEIHSGLYHYKITDYEILVETQAQKPDVGFNTLIVLPFKKKQQLECFNAVKQGLLTLNEYFLLFLKQIQKIEIFEDSKQVLIIEKQELQLTKNILKKSFIKQYFVPVYSEIKEVFLVVSKTISSKKPQPELAFKVSENQKTFDFIEIPEAPLFAYFPTKMSGKLNFLVHAPFTTNPLRDFIPFDTNVAPENLQLLKEIIQIFVLGLKCFIKSGYYNLQFLSKLPIKTPLDNKFENQNDIVYKEFFDSLKLFLSQGKTIPVKNNKVEEAKAILIPADDLLHNLLDEVDLKTLFQKRFFVDDSIVQDSFTELRNYFSNVIQIKIADAESFGFRIHVNPDFLVNKKTKWLAGFYSYIHSHQQLWDIQHKTSYYSLRNAAIILAQNNKFVPAFTDDDQPFVFLPHGKKSKLPVVHNKLMHEESSKLFFSDMGIRQPGVIDEVEYSILPQFAFIESTTRKGYFLSIDKIIEACRLASGHRKDSIISLLKETSFLLSENKSGLKKFMKPQDVYFFNDPLDRYFGQNSHTFFIEQAFFKRLDKKYPKTFFSFQKETGLNEFPKIVVDQSGSINIDGFEDFLHHIDLERSKAFIKILITIPVDNLNDNLVKLISGTKWLFSKSNTFQAPASMAFQDISLKYNFKNNELFQIAGILNFAETNSEIKKRYLDWQPAISPKIAANNIIEEKLETKNVTLNVSSILNTQMMLFSADDPVNTENTVYSDSDIEKIQQWSLEYVLEYLHLKNPDHSISVSQLSDILILKPENPNQYIFVSGKTSLMPLFPLSSNQLTTIIKLSKEADNVFLYLVSFAGNAEAEILIHQNPINIISKGTIEINSKIWISSK